MNNNPIGVFDSGVGGLSVLKVIHEQMPNENLIYLADSAHIPYGEKSPAFIVDRSLAMADFLISKKVKALVIACNTATAAAANVLREKYPYLPVVGMEPAVKPATKATLNGKVGVLATSGTLKSAKFAALLDRFANDIEVFAQPCPGLMECIERGELTTSATRQLLKTYLAPLLAAQCDTIILGCTHYPFLRPLLAELLPPSICVIDTGEAVARHVDTLLSSERLRADSGNDSQIILLTTGKLASFQQTSYLLWQDKEIIVDKVIL